MRIKIFSKTLFKGLGVYEKYIYKNKIDKILSHFNKNSKLNKKILKTIHPVRKEIKILFPELDDLYDCITWLSLEK